MNTYVISNDDIEDMFVKSAEAAVILDPLVEHYRQSSRRWETVSRRYFMKNAGLHCACERTSRDHKRVYNRLLNILYTCDEIAKAYLTIPITQITISLDHALQIAYYSSKYRNGGVVNVFAESDREMSQA